VEQLKIAERGVMDWLKRKPWQASGAEPAGPTQGGFIDVRELIQRLTDEELLVAANEYFAGMDLDSEQCHKPFSNIEDAIHIHHNLALVLRAAALFRGADVLDFGCATGWLSLSLASLGCQVVGVDIASNAIALAEQWKERRGVRPGGSASFRVYDGARLPLPDASVDRIVCFDSFHHVKDQAGTLREFARVLRPGGRIAMLEPGPYHSRTPQSQMEMARYAVIENDVDMRTVAAGTQAAGLEQPRMFVQMQVPLELRLDQYLEWVDSADMPRSLGNALLGKLTRQLTNAQCFCIEKPGELARDSRDPLALAAELRILSADHLPGKNRWRFRIQVRNVGEGIWRTQTSGIGEVNLGIQLIGPEGELAQRDFLRISLGGSNVQPGNERTLDFDVALPDPPGHSLRFDLVSEMVCWFAEQRLGAAVDWRTSARP
jgi:ubiquinone/menaquinone biosynthesis C-methylase UbiE